MEITGDNPVTRQSYSSTSFDSTADDDFESISTASNFGTQGIGWFYYHQGSGNACQTTFTGATSATLGLSGMTSLGTIAGPFPTMVFKDSGDGLGDYIGIIKRGIPGGWLYPTWSQPVVTSATCVACTAGPNSQQYSNAIFGTRVCPDSSCPL